METASVAQESSVPASMRRARRAATAHALKGLALDWADIDASPSWLALPDEDARKRFCASTGAWWLMASLRTCIDGKRLAKVRDLLGEGFLACLHQATDARSLGPLDQAPRPLLPPAEDIPAHLLVCGRALLGWNLWPHLRAPVMRHFGWSVDERHYTVFDTHAAWARHALEAAQQANSSVALNSESETSG